MYTPTFGGSANNTLGGAGGPQPGEGQMLVQLPAGAEPGVVGLVGEQGGAVQHHAAGGLGEASSIYPAAQNLLLAARAHGLGATLTIWHLFRETDFRRVLGVPKDYGIYANAQGELPVGFISNNDITGGNSGSPVINARGELIGTAFDGNWEAMSGDIFFETQLQRTISCDIRYVLFIIDKYAGAGHLVQEMTLVK
jgi:hypothetical protein